MSNPQQLVQKLWNYCNILRDDGHRERQKEECRMKNAEVGTIRDIRVIRGQMP
jgi:hypothetical protein